MENPWKEMDDDSGGTPIYGILQLAVFALGKMGMWTFTIATRSGFKKEHVET